MEINPNRSVGPVVPAASSAKAQAPAPRGGDLAFEQSAHLNAALAATPNSRASVVQRAEALVSQASYPPTEIIQRIANLLAANLLTQK